MSCKVNGTETAWQPGKLQPSGGLRAGSLQGSTGLSIGGLRTGSLQASSGLELGSLRLGSLQAATGGLQITGLRTGGLSSGGLRTGSLKAVGLQPSSRIGTRSLQPSAPIKPLGRLVTGRLNDTSGARPRPRASGGVKSATSRPGLVG